MTTKACDDLVERLRRERNDKEIQPLRADSPQGKAALAALATDSDMAFNTGPKKRGRKAGSKNRPKVKK